MRTLIQCYEPAGIHMVDCIVMSCSLPEVCGAQITRIKRAERQQQSSTRAKEATRLGNPSYLGPLAQALRLVGGAKRTSSVDEVTVKVSMLLCLCGRMQSQWRDAIYIGL